VSQDDMPPVHLWLPYMAQTTVTHLDSRCTMTAIYHSNLRALCHDGASNCLPTNKLFDFSSLPGVVLGLNYTTREGRYELRKKVEWKTCGCGDDVEREFEVRREYPEVRPIFEGAGCCHDQGGYRGSEHGDCDYVGHKNDGHDKYKGFSFPLRSRRGMFPYLPSKPDVKVT
jgi:hypothetical protein